MKDQFDHVDTWVFDLDNTLYPPHMRLFDQIEAKMNQYVMRVLDVSEAEADLDRRRFWQAYGTTLAGLMFEEQIDPEPFMEEVHDIDFSVLSPDPILRSRIAALPGARLIYTNGSAPYAEKVIEARGLSGLFDAIYGCEHAGYRPKPEATAFDAVFGQAGVHGPRAAMFEDEARNLEVPHQLGMRTVHVAPTAQSHPYIHHHTQDLSGFLAQLVD